jgi:GNAT superfamily N-acetyltransferase
MKITRAVKSDIDPIMTLIHQAVDMMLKNGIDQWNEHYPSREIITNDIATRSLFKITSGKETAGIIVLNESQAKEYLNLPWQDNMGKPVVVHRLCLHPDFQGKGLSRQLMQFTEAYAVKNKYTSIRLDTYSKNFKALNLFGSLQYHLVGNASFGAGQIFHCFEKVLE